MRESSGKKSVSAFQHQQQQINLQQQQQQQSKQQQSQQHHQNMNQNKYSYMGEIQASYNMLINNVGNYETFQEIQQFNEIIKQNTSLRQLFEKIMENLQNHQYQNAIFFGDKLLTLISSGNAQTVVVYLLGECYYNNQDYKKVHSLFLKYRLLHFNQSFQILAAKSLLKNQQYEICLNILDTQLDKSQIFGKLESQAYILKAQCHEANENKLGAIENYTNCLKKDPTFIEAFQRLFDCCLLSSSEKDQLLTYLNFNQEDLWVKQYYTQRIKCDNVGIKKSPMKIDEEYDMDQQQEHGIQGSQSKQQNLLLQQQNLFQSQQQGKMESENEQQQQKQIVNSENVYELLDQNDNIDILCIKAKIAHQNYDIQLAYDICVQAIKKDPLYFNIIPIYCACLLDLNCIGELYYCAHNLIENYSNHPLSWFAIGTYYYLTKKYEVSRKYFQKSIQIDRNFIYAWLGMAHSFAIQDESDQAMSVYRTISRLFPGCYSAHLYMGMEYLRTNNLKTAQLSFKQAKMINSQDPLIYNEIGVIYFKQKMFKESKDQYKIALNLCQIQGAVDWIVETILSNLAHTQRKLNEWKEAIKTYEKCINLNPKNPQTYFSLGYTYHIHNQLNKAISYYHKSLHYKHDNQFVQDMLNRCLTDNLDSPWNSVLNI